MSMSPIPCRGVSTLCCLVGVALAGFASTLRAESLPLGSMRDFWQTMQARKLLLDDPRLAPLNLGVKVVDGVATLWGPVPNAEHSFRAESCLRTMIELIDVRNQ